MATPVTQVETKRSFPRKAMALDEFYVRVEESEKAIKHGKIISQRDLEKEAENW